MKKIKFVLSFIVLFAVVATIMGCEATLEAAETTYVTIDINPSVELIVSSNDKVIEANALNEDAEVLLSGLDLIGMDLDEAVDLIIATSIELGYISVDEDVETYVSVSAISCDEALQERIKASVKEHINNAFESRGMLGRSQEKTFDQAFIDEAASFGVTPEFLFLAYKVVELSDDYTLEQAVLLTDEEVFAIIELARAENQGLVLELRNQFFEDRDAKFEYYLPQIQSLEAQIVVVEEQIAALEETEDQTELLATLDDLNAQLVALQDEFHGEVAALREQFQAERSVYQNQFAQERQQRREQHQEQVNQFQQEMEDRCDRMQDRVDEFQGNANDNGSTSSNKS
ncbi:anti-sigma-I factor RsgI family protein [Mariniplasma anaerobium]|uniref:Anti-sigma factor RsgI-like middle domain-containing protein n=1 Tax=Mariniplasma anaerobium TaxID=2735436 RepID=A0A7U9TGV3_9MOLU|nr:hypothetical protein [Mariniplasma anaerobium]BCR36423.1 hypothetical protein MPAN_013160 [Mariniplasma anaerobium]